MAYGTSSFTPATTAPSYLQNSNVGQLQGLYGQLSGLFDTSQMTSDANNAIQGNYNQGRALAAAAGRAYVNRAQQSGASTLGAGFAEGQAMLPIYNQRTQATADLSNRQLQYHTAQAGAQSAVAGQIGQLQQAHAATLADYFANQQKMGLQNQQFNLDLGYRQNVLAQDQSQFSSRLGEQSREFNVGQSNQQNSQNAALRLQALGMALKMPQQSYGWSTTATGVPRTAYDMQQSQLYGQQAQNRTDLMSALHGYI